MDINIKASTNIKVTDIVFYGDTNTVCMVTYNFRGERFELLNLKTGCVMTNFLSLEELNKDDRIKLLASGENAEIRNKE